MKYLMRILALLMISYSIPVFGQHIVFAKWNGTLTGIRGLEDLGDVRKSVGVGASVVVPLQSRFGLQIDCDYVQKGIRNSLHYGIVRLDIDYIEFSGLGVVDLISSHPTPSLFLFAGPAVAFKVRNKGEEPLSKRFNRDPFEFKSLDFGVTAGIGTRVAILEEMIFKVELRYTHGVRAKNKSIFYILDFVPKRV